MFEIKRAKETEIPPRMPPSHWLKKSEDHGIFEVIKESVASAKKMERGDEYDIGPLLDELNALKRPRYFWPDGERKDDQGRKIVAFGRGHKTPTNTSRRMMLPLHFATTIALSLVPGFQLRMVDKTSGLQRQPADQIHSINLSVNPEKRKTGMLSATSLVRILFNAPPDASIRERRCRDFRIIIPENFILGRYRGRDNRTQKDVLKAVDALLGEKFARVLYPFTAREMTTLLRSLFRTSDKWYWESLLDRCEGDPRAK